MIVVSKDAQLSEEQGVALAFFGNFMDDYKAAQLFAAFTGISSLGNIIVMTFTAARVKQEIAKEGILPFAKIFGESFSKDDPKKSNFTSGIEPIPVGRSCFTGPLPSLSSSELGRSIHCPTTGSLPVSIPTR